MYTLSYLLKLSLLVCLSMQILVVAAANQKKSVLYWGQNSIGSFTNAKDAQEKSLTTYCSDPNIDIIVVGFVYLFPMAPGGSTYPGMNFANHCEVPFSDANPFLLNCTGNVAPEINYCQSIGKTILLSFGGGIGPYGFSSESDGVVFGNKIWNMFLGGSGDVRPFGNAIFDGVDLDIEGGADLGYISFINTLRGHFASSSKKYYISAAPQCFYPDRLGPAKGSTLSSAWFDYIWVQFYNNHCGLDETFNFNVWAAWAATGSINSNVQIFIGAPASAQAAASGYVSLSTLKTLAASVNTLYPNIYGGIMIWDASTSDANSNFASSIGAFVHTQASVSIIPATPAIPSASIPTPSAPATSASPVVVPVPATPKPSTTGKKVVLPATTGKKVSLPSTTGKKISLPSTTGRKIVSAPAPVPVPAAVPSTTGMMATQPTVSATTAAMAAAFDGTCTEGHMACATSETYRMCSRGTWAAAQSCQVGLTCTPSGNFIYCQ